LVCVIGFWVCISSTLGADATVSQAIVSVDWASGLISVRAALPAGVAKPVVVIPPAPGDSRAGSSAAKLDVTLQGTQVTLRGSADAVAAAVVDGTRSLRIREADKPDGPTYRIDLPALDVDPRVSTYRYPNFTEGLALFVPLTGLRPGYTVRCAADGIERKLSTEGGRLPRVADVVPAADGTTRLRLIVPFLDDPAAEATYRLTVVNPDGSRSAALAVYRRGGADVATAKVVAPARPAPADALVEVPSVELLELADAQARARAAGLVPVAVSLATFEPLDDAAIEAIRRAGGNGALTVIRQGAESGFTLRRGEDLLLGVRDLRNGGSDAAVQATDDPNTSEPAKLDVGDELGFVDLNGDDESRPAVLDDSTLSDSQDSVGDEAPSYLAIKADPGVWLDPTTSPEQVRTAAIVKLTLDAIVAGLGRGQGAALGPIGRAVREAVQQNESEMATAVRKGGRADQLPIEGVFRTVLSVLGVSLEDQAREEALKAWREGPGRASLSALDRNRNGRYADDVALAFIGWLIRTGHYDPSLGLALVMDAAGRPAVRLGGGSTGSTSVNPLKLGSNAGGNTKPAAKPEPKIPEGPAEVDAVSTPDLVRIPPDLIGLSVNDAAQRLGGLDLITANLTSYFSTDQVADANPKAGQWVPERTEVKLTVRRKTPRVVGMTLAQAESTLRDWRFGSNVLDQGPLQTDYVAEQDPAAGEPIDPAQKIRLQLERVVPDVRGQYSGTSVQNLRDAGFSPRFARGLSRWDTVTSQEPGGGQRARLQGEVRLTFQRPIPDVRQRSFTEVQKILGDYRLKAVQPDDFQADDDLYVANQRPVAGPGPVVGPDDDGELKPIALTSGRKLPDVREEKLEEARAALERLDLRVDGRDGFLERIPMKVLSQSPVVGSIVALESTVSLKVGPVGPLVPDVREVALSEAIQKLEGAGLKASYPDGAFLTDQVVVQDPLPYGPDSPSWLPNGSPVALEIVTKVPNIVGMTITQANQLLRSWDMRLLYPEKTFGSDVVVEQDPAANRYVSHKSDVTATVKLAVPDIRQQVLTRARNTLNTWDLEVTYEGDAFDDDLVVGQDPAPGTLADHGSRVSVRLFVVVPDVRGETLAQAKEILNRRDLEAEVSNGNALDSDVVRGQSVAPNQYVEHKSAVTLGPIVGHVPNLVGRTIGDARQILRDQENFQTQYDDGLQDEDVVTAQQPQAGAEIERGGTVELGAMVQVPDLVRQSVEAAAAALNNTAGNLQLKLTLDGRDSDVVIAQDPEAGRWTNPRSAINVTPGYVVPRLIGLSEEDALGILRDLGVRGVAGGVRTMETPNPNAVGRSEVAEQSQTPESIVARDTPIEYQIVRFVEEAIRVPNLIGARSIESIREAVTAAGLEFRIINSPENGPVRDQQPPPGANAQRGDLVTVFFPPRRPGNDNQGGDQDDNSVEVPPVEGMIVQRAAGILARSNLRFEFFLNGRRVSYRELFERTRRLPDFEHLHRIPNPSPRAPIDFQFPRPGARVPAGSIIRLIVDGFPPAR